LKKFLNFFCAVFLCKNDAAYSFFLLQNKAVKKIAGAAIKYASAKTPAKSILSGCYLFFNNAGEIKMKIIARKMCR
jgi:hypothetical protein